MYEKLAGLILIVFCIGSKFNGNLVARAALASPNEVIGHICTEQSYLGLIF
jgi:hypothetical protein